MRTFIYGILLVFVAACSNNKSNESGSESNNYNSSNNTAGTGRNSPPEQLNNEADVDDDAATFIKKAGGSSVFEIELGKLAQEKATSSRVKSFGYMMVKDHTKSNEELKVLASTKNILITYSLSPEQKDKLRQLQKLTGAGFDKRYMDLMISEHNNDLQVFERGGDTRDKEVNEFAKKTLPVLKMHSDSAKL